MIHFSDHKMFSHLFVVVITTITLTLSQHPCCVATAAHCGDCGVTTNGSTYHRYWSESPVAYDGIQLGFESRLNVYCDACYNFPPSKPCSCDISLPASVGLGTEHCTNCTILSLTENTFELHWDCSNLFTGDCAALGPKGCNRYLAESAPSPAGDTDSDPSRNITANPTSSPVRQRGSYFYFFITIDVKVGGVAFLGYTIYKCLKDRRWCRCR